MYVLCGVEGQRPFDKAQGNTFCDFKFNKKLCQHVLLTSQKNKLIRLAIAPH